MAFERAKKSVFIFYYCAAVNQIERLFSVVVAVLARVLQIFDTLAKMSRGGFAIKM